MAVTFENKDVTITEERIQHIMEHHVNVPKYTKNTSVFFETFNIVSTLAFLTHKTWREDESYEIIEQGRKEVYGNYFLYVFGMRKPVGVDPWGFPSKKLAIYYSWRREYGDKFKIISAYPFPKHFRFINVTGGWVSTRNPFLKKRLLSEPPKLQKSMTNVSLPESAAANLLLL